MDSAPSNALFDLLADHGERVGGGQRDTLVEDEHDLRIAEETEALFVLHEGSLVAREAASEHDRAEAVVIESHAEPSGLLADDVFHDRLPAWASPDGRRRSEEHTSELQSPYD